MLELLIALQVAQLLLLAVLLFLGPLRFRRPKGKLAVEPRDIAPPAHADGHHWTTEPQVIVNTEGQFGRWTCVDCGSFVQEKRTGW